MRLLFITNTFPTPDQPTRGVFNLDMARALAERHTIQVVSPVSWVDAYRRRFRSRSGPKDAPRQAVRRATLAGGIEVHYPRFYYPPKILHRHYGWFFWQSTRRVVGDLLASYRPEAILSYWVHPDGETAVRAARLAGIPAIVITGGSDVLLLTRDPARKRCIEQVLRQADAVVAVSEDLARHVASLGVDPGKIHTMLRGVDTSRFSPGDAREARLRLGLPTEGPMMLWVGRMVPVKGLEVLIEACRALRPRHPDLRLYLVGDGALRASIQAAITAAGLDEMVRLVGLVPHEALADWFRAADLTVLPSLSEGIPNVLRESLACGTPFVASQVGGIPELARNGAGWLVPPGDPAALAATIDRVLTDSRLDWTAETGVRDLQESVAPLNRLLESLVAKQEPGSSH